MEDHWYKTAKKEEEPVYDPETDLVLTKFGKTSLHELLELIEKEDIDTVVRKIKHRPPVWRRREICSPEEIADAEKYAEIVRNLAPHADVKGL